MRVRVVMTVWLRCQDSCASIVRRPFQLTRAAAKKVAGREFRKKRRRRDPTGRAQHKPPTLSFPTDKHTGHGDPPSAVRSLLPASLLQTVGDSTPRARHPTTTPRSITRSHHHARRHTYTHTYNMLRPRLIRAPLRPRLSSAPAQSRLLPLACQARSLHSVPPLDYNLKNEAVTEGLGDFLSPSAFNISWTQYQTHILERLNALTHGMSSSSLSPSVSAPRDSLPQARTADTR